MARPTVRTITLHALAPPKPAAGEGCNGCGICCAYERCPPALLFLPRQAGLCPALEWEADAARYRCGLARRPAHHVRWLPRRWEAPAARWFAARIAAGTACDCDAVEIAEPSAGS